MNTQGGAGHVHQELYFFSALNVVFCVLMSLTLASSQQIKRSLWNRRLNLDVPSLACCSSSSSCCYWDWPESPPPAGWLTCRRKPCACRSTSPWTTAYPGPKSRRLWSDSWRRICRRQRRSFLNPHKRLRTKLSSGSISSSELQVFHSHLWILGLFFFFFFFNMLKSWISLRWATLHPLTLFAVLGGEESVQIDKGGWTDVLKSS